MEKVAFNQFYLEQISEMKKWSEMFDLSKRSSKKEVVAAETLTTVAGFKRSVQCNGKSNTMTTVAQASATRTSTIVTRQPGKGHHYVSFSENQTKKSMILSVNHNEQVKQSDKLPSPIIENAVLCSPKAAKPTSTIPNFSSKSKSSRISKRKQSDDEKSPKPVESSNPVKKVATGKRAAPESVEEIKASVAPEEINPSKKMRTSAAVVPKSVKLTDIEVVKERSVNVFSKDVKMAMQTKMVHRSRHIESTYESKRCTKLDSMVDFRAATSIRTSSKHVQFSLKSSSRCRIAVNFVTNS